MYPSEKICTIRPMISTNSSSQELSQSSCRLQEGPNPGIHSPAFANSVLWLTSETAQTEAISESRLSEVASNPGQRVGGRRQEGSLNDAKSKSALPASGSRSVAKRA